MLRLLLRDCSLVRHSLEVTRRFAKVGPAQAPLHFTTFKHSASGLTWIDLAGNTTRIEKLMSSSNPLGIDQNASSAATASSKSSNSASAAQTAASMTDAEFVCAMRGVLRGFGVQETLLREVSRTVLLPMTVVGESVPIHAKGVENEEEQDDTSEPQYAATETEGEPSKREEEAGPLRMPAVEVEDIFATAASGLGSGADAVRAQRRQDFLLRSAGVATEEAKTSSSTSSRRGDDSGDTRRKLKNVSPPDVCLVCRFAKVHRDVTLAAPRYKQQTSSPNTVESSDSVGWWRGRADWAWQWWSSSMGRWLPLRRLRALFNKDSDTSNTNKKGKRSGSAAHLRQSIRNSKDGHHDGNNNNTNTNTKGGDASSKKGGSDPYVLFETIQQLSYRLTVFIIPSRNIIVTCHRFPIAAIAEVQDQWDERMRTITAEGFLRKLVVDCAQSFLEMERARTAEVDALEDALFTMRAGAIARSVLQREILQQGNRFSPAEAAARGGRRSPLSAAYFRGRPGSPRPECDDDGVDDDEGGNVPLGVSAASFRSTLEEVYCVSREASAYCRVLRPLHHAFEEARVAAHFTDKNSEFVKQRIQAAVAMCDGLREQTSALLSLQFSVAANQLENLMRLLTVFSTVFIPLELVTALFGMNFDFFGALYASENGIYVFLAVLLLTAALTQRWLRSTRVLS